MTSATPTRGLPVRGRPGEGRDHRRWLQRLPAELERVLSRSSAVAEVAVVGRAAPELGEVPVACVVPAPGHAVAGEDVLAMCDGKIAAYKRPRELRVVESLPRNALGKLLRHEVKKLVTSTSPPRPGRGGE